MAKRIPPLGALRVFAAVARTLNLTQAAQELNVTQSAVSRQVSTLESYLGIALFSRERHGVVLTPLGEAYARDVLPAFDDIASATERLFSETLDGALRVRTYTTFAAKWLVPRLLRFKRLHPGIEVRISTAVPDVDFDRDAADLAIQFGAGDWPRTSSDLLFPDEIEPVCAPGYLAEFAPAGNAADALLRQRLLVSHYRRRDWQDWLAANALDAGASGSERMVFSSSILTWQAAVDGLGVAIGQRCMLSAEMASGRLVRPFGRPLRRGLGHYLVRPALQRHSAKVTQFRDWLLDEVARDQA